MRTGWLAVLAGMLAAVGCKSDLAAGAEGESEGEALTLEELPAAYAEVLCQQLETCLGTLGELFFDPIQCLQDISHGAEQATLPQLEAAIDAGTIVYDAERAQECLETITASGCDFFENQPIEACDDIFQGSVDEGNACNIDEECADANLYCENATCPGVCTQRLPRESDCANNDECSDGLVCDENLGTCETPAADGDPCGGTTEPACALGLSCWGGDDMNDEPGTCSDLATLMTEAEGDACDPRAGPLCQPDLACVVLSVMPAPAFECQPQVASGATCNLAFPSACPAEEYCADTDPKAGDIQGTCEPLPGDGEACTSTFPPCATGTHCIDTVCIVLRDLGGDCEDDAWCYSHACVDAGCAEPAACEIDDTDGK